jgi:hypothetical protein
MILRQAAGVPACALPSVPAVAQADPGRVASPSPQFHLAEAERTTNEVRMDGKASASASAIFSIRACGWA